MSLKEVETRMVQQVGHKNIRNHFVSQRQEEVDVSTCKYYQRMVVSSEQVALLTFFGLTSELSTNYIHRQ